ncbi:MAG: hypothetical protein K2J13_00800 [Clostridia bacterium]|nr:hypothetical protein [Clostridia bacterium]
MKNDKRIIKIKQSIDWNLTFYLLQQFYFLPEIINDTGFREKFDILFNYVTDKITTPYDGDIKDIYVIVEQEMER